MMNMLATFVSLIMVCGGVGQSVADVAVGHLDLMMVLDGSKSVNEKNFEIVKTWVKNLTSKFDINSTSFGVVQYSLWQLGKSASEQDFTKVEIKLGQYKTQESFDKAVDNIKYQGISTDTAHAINLTVQEFESSAAVNNQENHKVMVLLTDGRSNEHLNSSAEYARSRGITTFAVGIGDAPTTELEVIAGNPERIIKLDNFAELQTIVDQMKHIIDKTLKGTTTTAIPAITSIAATSDVTGQATTSYTQPSITLKSNATSPIVNSTELTTVDTTTLAVLSSSQYDVTKYVSSRSTEIETTTATDSPGRHVTTTGRNKANIPTWLQNDVTSLSKDPLTLERLNKFESHLKQLAEGNLSSVSYKRENLHIVAEPLPTKDGVAETDMVPFSKSSVKAKFNSPKSSGVSLVMFELVTAKSLTLNSAHSGPQPTESRNKQVKLTPIVFIGVSGYDNVTGKKQNGSVSFSSNVTENEVCDKVKETSKTGVHGRLNMTCVFIDQSAEFSTAGCRTRVDGSLVSCECDHLTVFSILLSTTTTEVTQEVKILSYVCESISVVFLVATIALLLIHKREIASDRTLIQLNVSLALLLLHVTNLFHDLALNNNVGCLFLAATIQYFLLATGCWFMLDGIRTIMAVKFPMEFHIQNARQRSQAFLVVGWLAPALIVALSLAIGLPTGSYMQESDLYAEYSHCPSGVRKYDRCWLAPNTTLFYLVVITPLAIVLAVNFCVSVISALEIFSSKKKMEERMGEEEETAVRSALASFAFLMLVFGMTWVLGFFTGLGNDVTSEVMTYVNAIVNGLQGVAVFYCYCMQNAVVRKKVLAVCCERGKTKFRIPKAPSISHSTKQENIQLDACTIQRENEVAAKKEHTGSGDESQLNREALI